MEVRFLSNIVYGFKIFNLEQSTHFDNLNYTNFSAFENLKCFRFFSSFAGTPVPFLIDTVLNVLKGSQKTLASFELAHYCFADVNVIIDYICSKNIPLKVIKFHCVDHLTYSDVLRIAKTNKNRTNKLLIRVTECMEISFHHIELVRDCIEKNNLNCKVEFLPDNF